VQCQIYLKLGIQNHWPWLYFVRDIEEDKSFEKIVERNEKIKFVKRIRQNT
jgi:hypothetical protein